MSVNLTVPLLCVKVPPSFFQTFAVPVNLLVTVVVPLVAINVPPLFILIPPKVSLPVLSACPKVPLAPTSTSPLIVSVWSLVSFSSLPCVTVTSPSIVCAVPEFGLNLR